ncbi:hypothetical protein [Paracidovorax wautersii]|uniref:hypothetical protein n=1 Tax=Paracidovorax wautersii TaxID=1177982 RepID=UPI0031CE3EA6
MVASSWVCEMERKGERKKGEGKTVAENKKPPGFSASAVVWEWSSVGVRAYLSSAWDKNQNQK